MTVNSLNLIEVTGPSIDAVKGAISRRTGYVKERVDGGDFDITLGLEDLSNQINLLAYVSSVHEIASKDNVDSADVRRVIMSKEFSDDTDLGISMYQAIFMAIVVN